MDDLRTTSYMRHQMRRYWSVELVSLVNSITIHLGLPVPFHTDDLYLIYVVLSIPIHRLAFTLSDIEAGMIARR
jgi:hypothetical protein